jgi:hypothetical protein
MNITNNGGTMQLRPKMQSVIIEKEILSGALKGAVVEDRYISNLHDRLARPTKGTVTSIVFDQSSIDTSRRWTICKKVYLFP